MKKLLLIPVLFIMIMYFLLFLRKYSDPSWFSSARQNIEIANHFGTKTSYFKTGYTDDSTILVPGCKPVLFWFLARHGTRNPSYLHLKSFSSDIPMLRDNIVKAWEDGKGSLGDTDVKYMETWSLKIGLHEAGRLTRSGCLENLEMGQRWRKRVHMLGVNSTIVRSSSSIRSRESANCFLEGFFNNSNLKQLKNPEIQIDNQLLRFYEHCTKWLSEVDNGDEENKEKHEFENSRVFSDLIVRVSDKIGIEIKLKDVNVLWEICRFEAAQYSGVQSPWCNMFCMQDISILEFREDLKYFYRRGPAFNITKLMTQPLWRNIVEHIEWVISNNEQQTILNFGPSVMPLLTALGLYRDDKDLEASDWPNTNHMWKTSEIGAFSSNVGIHIFDCMQNKKRIKRKVRESWRVAVFHQERPVKLPACDELTCPLDRFLESFRYLSLIDFNSTCA